jgi:hypothetical protein
MKPLYMIAASALALTTAACGTGAPKARTALDCPQTQGDLTRTSVATDGKTCTYVSTEGAEVTLQLVSVQGGPDATLKAIEATLLGQQEVAAKAEGGKGEAGKTDAKATAGASADAGAAAAEIKGARSAADAVREAAADAAASPSDKRDVAEASATTDHKGKRVTVARGAVVVDDEDGTTHVNLPGIHIDADDETDSANVDIGPLHVNAGGDGATIRIRRDVRLRGEQLSREKRGIRATFISERESLDDSYHFVAYEAAGPKVGPLTVAVVKAKTDVSQGDRVYKAIRRLVRANGGV